MAGLVPAGLCAKRRKTSKNNARHKVCLMSLHENPATFHDPGMETSPGANPLHPTTPPASPDAGAGEPAWKSKPSLCIGCRCGGSGKHRRPPPSPRSWGTETTSQCTRRRRCQRLGAAGMTAMCGQTHSSQANRLMVEQDLMSRGLQMMRSSKSQLKL
jgi:hypothetical protein